VEGIGHDFNLKYSSCIFYYIIRIDWNNEKRLDMMDGVLRIDLVISQTEMTSVTLDPTYFSGLELYKVFSTRLYIIF
jgi:hypothetical protein